LEYLERVPADEDGAPAGIALRALHRALAGCDFHLAALGSAA
jgi:hypothetical protein